MAPYSFSFLCYKMVNLENYDFVFDFWEAANRRFVQLEAEMTLHDFCYVIFGFCRAQMIDAQAFFKYTNRALLTKATRVAMIDLSMICDCALKVDAGREV